MVIGKDGKTVVIKHGGLFTSSQHKDYQERGQTEIERKKMMKTLGG